MNNYQLSLEGGGEVVEDGYAQAVSTYLNGQDRRLPALLKGDCRVVMAEMSSSSIDCVMTSPPYWGQREYSEDGIGLERTSDDYISNILEVTSEIKRVLKPGGSFWLNLGDRYVDKRLMGIPWRITIAMMDRQGWILRNEVIWNKVKGAPDNSKDKLRNVHEHLFHFVRSKTYYYTISV